MAEETVLTYGFEKDKTGYKIPLSEVKMMHPGTWPGSKAVPRRAGLHKAIRSQPCHP